jgi:23S rRNA pseudouridine955/2504/2580 synthase
MIELEAGKDDSGRRLDRVIRKALPDCPLSLIHRLLRQKKIKVNGLPASPNTRIEQGMIIRINVIVNHTNKQVNDRIVNQKYKIVNIKNPAPGSESPVPILWQGSGIIVFNKPQGLSTHGQHSLDNIVNTWLASGGGGPLPRSLSFKPGPLHRLDKPTSGAIIFSQTLEGAKLFSSLLRERKLEKTYIAIVEGCIASEKGKVKSEKSKFGEIIWRDSLEHDKNTRKSLVIPPLPTPDSLLLTPKQAVTFVKTLVSNGSYSLIEARIKTGRYHQIRAQAASHGHPLAGDIKYGAKPLPGQMRGGGFFLHAWKITCKAEDIPEAGDITGRFPGVIIAPLPEAFQSRIEELFGKCKY